MMTADFHIFSRTNCNRVMNNPSKQILENIWGGGGGANHIKVY